MEEVSEYLTPPNRFGIINPGVMRGAYPTLRNFRYLSRLQLKTIVSLSPEQPTADLHSFAEMAGICIVHLPVLRMTALSDALRDTIISAVNICADEKNHPVYVHCLDGRRICSLVVLLLRRLQGWTPLYCLSEYWRYQAAFRGPLPTAEVEKTTKELEVFASKSLHIHSPVSMPKWLWNGDRSTVVQGVKMKLPPTPVSSSGTTTTNATTGMTTTTMSNAPVATIGTNSANSSALSSGIGRSGTPTLIEGNNKISEPVSGVAGIGGDNPSSASNRTDGSGSSSGSGNGDSEIPVRPPLAAEMLNE